MIGHLALLHKIVYQIKIIDKSNTRLRGCISILLASMRKRKNPPKIMLIAGYCY